MQIVDIKEERVYVPQYVAIKNMHTRILSSSPVSLEGTNAWLDTFDGIILGVVHDQKLLGACFLHTGRYNELSIFMLTPAKGHGSFLLQELEKKAKEKRIQKLWVWTKKNNNKAYAFFKKHNFQEIDPHDNGFRIVEDGHVLYKKLT